MKKAVRKVLITLLASSIFIILVVISKQYLFERLFLLIFNGNGIYKYVQGIFMIFFQISIYYIVFKMIEKRPVEELSKNNLLKNLGIGFLIGVITLLTVITILSIFGFLSFERTGNQYLATSIKLLIFFSLFALFEELVFRGIIYNNLQKAFGINIALLVSSSLFALAHVSNSNASLISFVAVFLGGAILGVLYSISNNIWLPYSFHIGWNFVQGILGLNVSGVQGINGIFKASFSGNKMITGGSFGIEASILTITATSLLFVALYLYRIKKITIPEK